MTLQSYIPVATPLVLGKGDRSQDNSIKPSLDIYIVSLKSKDNSNQCFLRSLAPNLIIIEKRCIAIDLKNGQRNILIIDIMIF